MGLIRVIRKFSQILSKHQKVRVVELTILMVIGGFLEMGSVSLVLPFMDVAMNPETIMGKPYVRWFCMLFRIESPQGFLMTVAISLAAIYILKNAYLLLEYRIQYRFVYGNMYEMQKRLLDYFIHRPYEYFLKVNSGEMLRIVNVDTKNTFNLLAIILLLFSETVVSVMLGIAVFVMLPMVTGAMAAVLLFLLLLIDRIIKPMLRKSGIDEQSAATGMNQWMMQSIQGIKELKVMRGEGFFQENYQKYGLQYVRAIRTYQLLGITPRFTIEAVSMAAMFVILAVLLYVGENLVEIVPVISAIALAAMRLLPSVNRISSALATISYSEPMLDKLIENLKDISGKAEISLMMDLTYMDDDRRKKDFITYKKELNFQNIIYRYPDSQKEILHQASMTIAAGESVGIVGESGAGKTTVVDIILGLLRPESGQVLVDGHDIMNDMDSWLAQVGYIPQMIFMLDDTIRMNVSFGIPESEFTDDDVWHALEEASLAEFVRGLPDGLDAEIGERGVRLSGGQRQRIGIARALFRNPNVLIFDEATSALDHNTESAIMESISRLHGQKTMIIIAHRLTTIEACDHIFRVENGKIWKER